MLREKNEYIAVKGFCYLILDFEFSEDKAAGLPAYCSGRVLCEDLYQYAWTAENRQEAIDRFLHGTLKAA